MKRDDGEPPYEEGSQSVPEHPTPPPGKGQSVLQTLAYIIGALAVLAGLAWLLVPLMG